MQTSVFVVHSCPLMRRGICSLIEDDPSLISVGEAGDIPKAIRKIHSAHPHIAMVEFADKIDSTMQRCQDQRNGNPGTSARHGGKR